MIRIALFALLLAAGTAHAADAPATTANAETASTADSESPPAGENAAGNDAPERPRSTGSLRETVTETMRTFTPSESIDVDKPVDFPANI